MNAVPHAGVFSVDIIGYLSDDIILQCEHSFAVSNLEAFYWKKWNEIGNDEVLAEYDKTDDPKSHVYGSMLGRARVNMMPTQLQFSNGSFSDEGKYTCEVFPRRGEPARLHYKLTVNGKEYTRLFR